jgi:hypothetical protein
MKLWSLFKKRQPLPTKVVRQRPLDWNKTISDLMSEKRTIPAEEIEWARSYEQENLRKWARFPKDREEFEATKEVTIDFVTHWQAPFTGGGTGKLPMGTRVRVSVSGPDPEPIGVYAAPLDCKRVEAELVPSADRLASKYAGFSLWISIEQLNKDFRRVE